jgi:endonuclease/exonuclease/phosphatase family metal-dependent hydrolase
MRAAILLVTSLAACGVMSSEEEGSLRGSAGQGEDRLSILTYNTGLAHGAVALAAERRPLLAPALKATGADVLCLQEVWTDEDYQALAAELAEDYPHAFRERTEDDSWRKIQCNPWNVYWLDRCFKESCTPKGISAEECVASPCAAEYAKLSDGCKRCLAANTASPSSCAIWGAKAFVSDGRNGLALFSRLPIEEARYAAFDTILVKRGVITARVAGLTVQCTHLTSNLGAVPYPDDRPFAGWAEEQAAQLDVVDRAAGREPGCRVLSGDLNTGPAGQGFSSELRENYSALLDRGFVEPLLAPRCTWCADNPLASAKPPLWLDHIMFRDCPAMTVAYSRVLDHEVEVTSLKTRLSDHYGLKVELSRD